MAISLEKALGVHPYSLSLRVERAGMIAGNLANVSTPGFKAKDIDFKAVMQDVAGQLEAPISQLNVAMSAESLYRNPLHISQDGNTVELHSEQAAYSQNAMDFETSLTFLKMKINGLHKAIEGK
ncbi:flagellar basal body rod protein FlgB [Paraferrimonas sp. SM1919]|uniref:flagellar basal body rod protein FlgB n=1 Tax=Paraferrimonas sp. SM1919 TaxID=2662263 RepID=UPI0013D2DAE9|nr:flagellar basal body rod protein FlgB [Paraferrimonas sp. SM1919]